MPKKRKPRRFRYLVDLEHHTQVYGVHGVKVFTARGEALAFAEQFAQENPDVLVSVRVQPDAVKLIPHS
jgi:thiamine pyrophosphate-dependent acetolactate synthase large subunit-like protein